MTTSTDHDVERYVDVDLYGVLQLTAGASAELIDRAYRMRLNQVHPDYAGAASTDVARLVNAAGAILRQPQARMRRWWPMPRTESRPARLTSEWQNCNERRDCCRIGARRGQTWRISHPWALAIRTDLLDLLPMMAAPVGRATSGAR